MDINTRLFLLMNQKNIKAVDLAKHLNINKTVISAWKSRGTNPPTEYIVQICELLEISVQYLLTGKDGDTLTPEEQQLLNAYRRAGRTEKEAILTNAKILAPNQDESSSCRTG